MNQKAAVPTNVIFIALIIISLAVGGVGFYLLQEEKAKAADLELKLEELSTKQKITESKYQELKKLSDELSLKYQDSQGQIDKLSKTFDLEKTARLAAEGRIEQLRTDLNQQKEIRQDLEAKFSQAQREAKKAQEQLNVLDTQRTELQNKIRDLEEKTQGIELGTIVVSPESAAQARPAGKAAKAAKEKPAPRAEPQKKAKVSASTAPQASSGVDAKILVVNKDYNFAVINLGSKDRVSVGNVFSVYHNNKYVGDLKVEKVHDSMAAAGFVSADLKDKISEGDKVMPKGK